MSKRHNKNGSQKKAGNATNNDTKLACAQETPVMDNPIELIQRLQTCFQSQETDSNALRSEMRRLEDKLKDTQSTLKNTREQSQVEISGLNLVINNLESNLENLREELQNKDQAFAELEEQYGDDVLDYEGGIKTSKVEKEKLQATVKELKSAIQAGCITTEVLKKDFDKELWTHRSEVESLKATFLKLQQKNMSKDIEVKPEPSNIDKCIPSASTDKANADCENCVLQSAQIKDMKINLAVLSRSLTQNDIGILRGLFVNTHNGEMTTFGAEFTPMQAGRKRDWQNSLLEMVRGRVSSQKNGPSEYRALVRKWQTSYSYLESLEISQYGISIETFARHKNSPRIQKLLDMRYEMKKFKTVQLSDTAFERSFQEIMRAVEAMEECQLPTSSQSNVDEDENVESTTDPVFLSMCSEYNEAAEYEKRRRKSDWKLGHNGQNMGDSIVDRTSY
ncbi:hypothetical protein BCON_0155g00220 [Botryotinia convoluta]|uniref:Uncharacterized protein n=1 Tax=Botryotinia convoluta TaxID=54673 RepID=A0A4Z1HRK1_9HELO|nr:hypothetical protein BCON_0155g00220 [Botryotinia convoluta]